jgi:hypothetical protein
MPMNILDAAAAVRKELRLTGEHTPAAVSAAARAALGLRGGGGPTLKEELGEVCRHLGIETGWGGQVGGKDETSTITDDWAVWEVEKDGFHRGEGVRLLRAHDYEPQPFYIKGWEPRPKAWLVLSCDPKDHKWCGPDMAQLWRNTAAKFENNPDVSVCLVSVAEDSATLEHARRFGAHWSGAVQMFGELSPTVSGLSVVCAPRSQR